MSDPHERANGPLFVVGPPRSGTKLLQSILNASPDVSIGPESHLFPKLLMNFGGLPLDGCWQEVLSILSRSNYLERLRRNGFEAELEPILQNAPDLPGTILSLLKEVARWQGRSDAEWIGDKTPNYVRYTSLFRRYFPEARFITIVRDPRDQALSVRRTWGKDPLLAAERWKKDLDALQEASREAPSVHYKLRYEDLLEAPENTIKGLCEYLNIPFDRTMLGASSSEKFGSGKNMEGVLEGNQRKYFEGFRPERIRRIEAICLPQLKEWGYPVHYADEAKGVGPVYRKVAEGANFLQNLRFNIKNRGLRRGLRYLIRIRRDKQDRG
ncbi:MAG: sulfotransferase [Flavobacteriales bacterium]